MALLMTFVNFEIIEMTEFIKYEMERMVVNIIKYKKSRKQGNPVTGAVMGRVRIARRVCVESVLRCADTLKHSLCHYANEHTCLYLFNHLCIYL